MRPYFPRKKELALTVFITLLITFVLYYPLFFRNSVAVNLSDATIKYLGYYKYAADNYAAGRVPMWYPFINLGQSMFSSQCSPFTILMIPYFFLLPEWANTFSVLFCLLLTLFCSWLFFRTHGLDRLGSGVGCAVYCFAGPVFFLHSYYPFMLAFSLFPLSAVFLKLWLDSRRAGYLTGLGLIMAVASLSISLDIFVYMAVGLSFYLAAVIEKKKRSIGFFSAWGFFVVSLLMINALHTVPLIEWLFRSARKEMTHGVQFFPALYNIISASLGGFFITEHNYPPYYFYIGIPAVILSLAGFLEGKRKKMTRFTLMSLIFLLFYGVLNILSALNIRVLGYMDPLRGLFVPALALGYMAGAGFRYLQGRNKNAALVLITILFIQNSVLALIHVSSFCCQFNYLIKTERLTYILLSYHVGSDAGDGRLTTYSKNRIETASMSGVRVMPFAEGAYNRNLKHTLQDKEGLLAGLDELGYHSLRLENPDSYLLSKYGVKFLIEPITVEDMVPPELRKGWNRRSDIRLYQGDMRKHLYSVLENENFAGRAYIVSENGKRVERDVFLQDMNGGKIICKIYNASETDRLVLSDLAFPGWKAVVNGKEKEWDIYGGCLRSVKLPEGKSVVEWTYNPVSFKVGLAVTFLGVACLTAAIMLLRKT